MKKYILYFLIILIGCSEDEVLPPIDTTTKLLQKIEYSATDYTEFNYDNQHRLTRYFQSWNNVIGDPNSVGLLEHIIMYDSDGRAASDEVRMNDHLIFTVTYHYQGNQLHRTEKHSPQHGLLGKSYFLFNAGRLISVTDSVVQNDQTYAVLKSDLAYYPDGNIKAMTERTKTSANNFEITYQVEYQDYDTHKNLKPFFWSDMYIPNINPQPNNSMKIMKGNPLNIYYSYSYEYDTEGFPLKATESVNGKPGITGQFKYKKKK